MALLDVNALVALAWDSHVHHAPIRRWFDTHGHDGWATCTVSESGFVRVSANPRVLPHAITVEQACAVLRSLRAAGRHTFLTGDVSPTDADVPRMTGHRQVTDGLLLTLARRRNLRLVTFDAGVASLWGSNDVELLS